MCAKQPKRPAKHWLGLFLCLTLAGCEDTVDIDEHNPSANVRWKEPITVARGNAHVGPWRMNESEFHYVDDASVDLRKDGGGAVVWVDNERRDVFFQRYNNQGRPVFDRPVNVSHSPEIFSWLPRVLVAGESRVYALWQEIVFSGGSHGGEIFFARSTDGGRSFSEPLNLSQTTSGAGKGRLSKDHWDNGSMDFALGPEGELVVAWTEYQGALRFRRSTDGGRSFNPAIQVGGNDQRPARGPSLAYGPERNLYLAWTVGENPEADIRLARSTDGGERFESVRTPYASRNHNDTPKLVVDSLGRVHMIYTDHPDGPGQPAQLSYIRLDPDGKPLEDPRVLNHGIANTDRAASAPYMSIDRQGRIYILWEQYPQPDKHPRGLGFSVSLDGGNTFSQPITVPGSLDSKGGINGSLQGRLARKLAVGSNGALAVSNSQFRPGDASRVLLIRGQLEP